MSILFGIVAMILFVVSTWGFVQSGMEEDINEGDVFLGFIASAAWVALAIAV